MGSVARVDLRTSVLSFHKLTAKTARNIAMRVCMLAYTFYERDNRVMRYAEAAADRGDDVDVIALRQPQDPAEEWIRAVHVHRIQKRVKNERNKLAYLFRILLFLWRSMIVLSLKHWKKPYSLIHVHSVPDFLVFAAWLPKLLGVPVILDIHDLSPELYATKFTGQSSGIIFRYLCVMERASAAFASHVIVPNHLWRDKLTARSVPRDRLSVFMNLPDPSVFRKSGKVQKEEGKFLLLYPGSLQWHQGLDIAIQAMAQVDDNCGQTELHIYGDGQAKSSLIALTAQCNLQDRVYFHDTLPLREMASLMERADVGIIPKRSDSFGNEAFSTKSLEFMALGVPVLMASTAVDRYYFNETVVTFFRSGSSQELAEQIGRLIRDPARRCRQAECGLDLVARAFQWSEKKHEYLRLLDKLVSGVRGAPPLAAVEHDS